jgi:mRNA interferase MazF
MSFMVSRVATLMLRLWLHNLGLSVMKRGDIWWASLPSPVGSGPGYKRPVLIIQANPFNASRISTVIVAVITSNLALAEAPGNVRIGKSDSGLSEASVVNVSQIITVDRGILSKKVKALSGAAMEKVAEGLKLVLALP